MITFENGVFYYNGKRIPTHKIRIVHFDSPARDKLARFVQKNNENLTELLEKYRYDGIRAREDMELSEEVSETMHQANFNNYCNSDNLKSDIDDYMNNIPIKRD